MGRNNNNNELSSATTTTGGRSAVTTTTPTTSSSSSRFVVLGDGEEGGQTLEDFANALCDGKSKRSSGGGKKQKGGGGGGGDDARAFFIEIHRWTQDSRIYLLKFPSPLSQKMALGRASVFLEDVDLHGRVVEQIPSGQSGGAANYSGHNMRVNSWCAFLNKCKEEKRALFDEEKALRDRLMELRIMRTNKRGEYESGLGKDNDPWHPSEEQSAILAVCSSSDKEEVRDALIHEAMHGVFYVSRAFQKFCYWFWEESMTEEERKTWVDFLVGLRYNAENDVELAVNELQAYMATERKLFEASDAARLKQLQLKFSRAITEKSTLEDGNFGLEEALTPSVGSSTKLVWL